MASSATSIIETLFPGFTQETRLLRLTTVLGSTALLAECVRGEEGLDLGFRFVISALSTDAAIPLKSLLGQPALLELMTAHSRDVLRPFHGYISAIEHAGANGGFARYQLTLAPWTSFASLGRDSRSFQDMSVFDIIDAVFGEYQGQGKLAPEWRFDIADRALYAKRSLTTQYQESNFAFVQRLMAEEGLFHYFEHTGDAASPSLGSHVMVIADHNGAFQPNVQAAIRFTQSGAVMKEDGLDRWRAEVRQQPNALELGSWDYRTLDPRPVQAANGAADAPPLVLRDTLAPYAYPSRQHGQRMAERLLEGLAARKQVYVGAGTVRTLAPGTTFSLHGQAQADAAGSDAGRSFTVTRVVHLMHNNLSAELKADVASHLAPGALAQLLAEEEGGSLHAVGAAMGQRPLYRNRIDAIPAATPYRTCLFDQEGRRLFPRPVVRGQQTAIVVGPSGSVVHTDRDHRVKVQFHWQRGAQSHSRLDHPAGANHSGAPADDTAGTWVRVATPLAPVAGANWGSHALPRVGQEVLIDFLEGDIDRPAIIGVLHNGKGQADAQHNQVAQGAGAATGNAPPWFPGEAGAHAHGAVLSGLKSQAMSASQGGAGAYSQLVLDDSPGQARLSLQRHAQAHKGTDELNLGQLSHQSDNQRLAAAGFGAELKSEHSAALRAGKGMLLSTHARADARGEQLDSREAIMQINASIDLQKELATTAHKHNAKLPEEPAPDKLPAIARLADSLAATEASATGSTSRQGAGGGQVHAYSKAQLQLSAAAGIAALTPASATIAAGATSNIVAGQDINLTAQGNLLHAVRSGISLFTYGKATNAEKPNQEDGIRLHAGTGKVSVQSQEGATAITADRSVTVASVGKTIQMAAKQHVQLTAQGAMLKLEGGNIMLHGPGTISFKAGKRDLPGPQASKAALPLMPRSDGEKADQHFILKSHKGKPIPNKRYRALTGNQVIEGFTDAQGRSKVLDGYMGQLARFELIDESHDEHFIIRDPAGEPVANLRYKIRTADGVEVEGVTDEDGQTALFTSDKIEKIDLFIVPEDFPAAEGTD